MIQIDKECPICGNTKCRIVSHQIQCLACLAVIGNDKDITWDDLAIKLDKAREDFEEAIQLFDSLSKTYQDFIDYCKAMEEK